MMSGQLDEQRCSHCQKLLFRGVLGIGFIETKCARCGTVNLIHNFDGILEGRSDAYIIVHDPTGVNILASQSVEAILGYTVEEICQTSIHDMTVRPDGKQAAPDGHASFPAAVDSFHAWEEQLHAHMPTETVHRTKSGTSVAVNARYYPLHAMTTLYTMCVFYVSPAAEPTLRSTRQRSQSLTAQ